MGKNEQQCKDWREAAEAWVVNWNENVGWHIDYGVESGTWSIDYCPFCGSSLDEKGCIKNWG